ncbi:MAG TPA: S9 family peptidase [Candidatus Eisenbacteria bacterium]
MTRPMSEEDLLRFTWVADPQISPDGSRVAFTKVWIDEAEDDYRTQVWMVEATGGTPRPLTAGQRDSQPRWSPDGQGIAFVRATEAKKPGQLCVLAMGGGEAMRLTHLEGGVSDPCWSPDGKRIAFLSTTNRDLDDPKREKPKNEPGRIVTRPEFRMNDEGFIDRDHLKHLWVIETSGGEPRLLTQGRFAETSPRWSRDGRSLLFVSDRRPEPWFGVEDSNLYAVSPDLSAPTEGEALQQVTEFRGFIAAYIEAADGRLALIGALPTEEPRSYEQPHLLLGEGSWPARAVKNAAPRYDFDVGGDLAADQHPPRGGGEKPLAFAPDGRSVVTVVVRHGACRLARFDLERGDVTELTGAHQEVIAGTCAADGRRWALTVADVTRPGDLYLFDAADDTLTKLWGPNDELLAGLELGAVEEIWYESFDGRTIQGWIVRPPRFDPTKRYPLLLQIHGGPHIAFGVGFFHEFRVLAGAGYVVLYTNPRGSTGYGQEFGNLIQYRYPGDDYHDLMAGVDEVLRRGFVDPQRLGVTGGSGGGLLTNWAITQTDRFAAAITQRCVSEWESFYYSTDFTMFVPVWFRKPPFEDPTEYRLRSPVAQASRIRTPLMIIHSEDDWRTPIGQGEAMFRALKQQRKAAVMVRFPGESHELSRSGTPSRRVQNQRHIRAWFDRWLMGKEAPEYDE